MNRKWWKFIFVLPIFLCILYAGGYIAQFISNYQVWTNAGNFAGNGSYPKAPPCIQWHAYQHWLSSHITCMGFFFAFLHSDSWSFC